MTPRDLGWACARPDVVSRETIRRGRVMDGLPGPRQEWTSVVTRQRELKERIRERMQKTGERYTAARAQIISALVDDNGSDTGRLLPSQCRDTGAVRTMLRMAGVVDANSKQPLSEAMVYGLSGGVGFLYIVFEYAGMPPILSVLMRYDTSQDQFVFGGLSRLGIKAAIDETSSAAKAEKSLLDVIERGGSAACVVDMVTLWPGSMPKQFAGQAPTVVGILGLEGDDFLVDAGGTKPLRVSRQRIVEARAAFKKGKNRMASVPSGPTTVDLRTPIHEAVAACAERYETAPYKGFASNFGLAGMEKWAKLLTDERDKKGWPTLFPEGRLACLGLRRVYEGLQHEMTSAAGGRPMYADFLREAAAITGGRGYEAAAKAADAAGERWAAIASMIAGCDVKDVRTGCDLLDAYAEMLDDGAADGQRAEAAQRLRESLAACTMTKVDALQIYRELSSMVSAARDAEANLMSALRTASGG